MYPNDKNAPLSGNFNSLNNVGDYGLAAGHRHRAAFLHKVSLHPKKKRIRTEKKKDSHTKKIYLLPAMIYIYVCIISEI